MRRRPPALPPAIGGRRRPAGYGVPSHWPASPGIARTARRRRPRSCPRLRRGPSGRPAGGPQGAVRIGGRGVGGRRGVGGGRDAPRGPPRPPSGVPPRREPRVPPTALRTASVAWAGRPAGRPGQKQEVACAGRVVWVWATGTGRSRVLRRGARARAGLGRTTGLREELVEQDLCHLRRRLISQERPGRTDLSCAACRRDEQMRGGESAGLERHLLR